MPSSLCTQAHTCSQNFITNVCAATSGIGMCEVSVLFKRSKEAAAVICSSEPLSQDASWVISPFARISLDSWSALPRNILVQILQHVPVRDRFRHCAFVSTDWAAAAIEATAYVCMPGRCYNFGNLQSWLVQHGSGITAVSLTGQIGQELVVLPCAKLRQLDLSECAVQLLPTVAGLFPGILKDLNGLTQFTLRHASVVGGPQALSGLAALTGLQHLALADLDTKQTPPTNTDWFPVPGSIFSHLTRLTHLELDRCVASSTLQHLEQLTALQHLLLGRLLMHNTSAAALSGLGSLHRLQWLCIEGFEPHISTSSVPSLGQLTGLTRLQLLNCKGFQPILLSGMLQLQVLDIEGTPLLGTGEVANAPAGVAAADGGGGAAAAGAQPAVAAALGPAAGAGDAAGADDDEQAAAAAALQAAAQAAAGAAALLLELPKLQHLTELSLVQVLWSHAAGLAVGAYAALSASSNLQLLDLSFSILPTDSWRKIFCPDTQMLPDLKSLNIFCSLPLITDADLGRMVQCCPELRSLGLKGTLQQGLGMEALLGFSALTSLSVNHVKNDEVLGVLGQLRGLEELQMSVLSSIQASGLMQLSTLTALTRLRVESSPETWIAKYGMLLLQNQASAGSPPDVWSQLQRWCLHKMQRYRPTADPQQQQQQEKGKEQSKKKQKGLLRWLARCVSP